MRYIIFYAALLLSFQANAWVINANFEKGKAGSDAQGSNAFGDAFSNTKYTNKVVHGGALAAVTSIKKGETGFGKWGGTLRLPSKLGQGDELWYRAWIYYPKGFDFSNTGVGVKTLRIHSRTASGSNEGYFDLLTQGSNGVTVNIEQARKEFISNHPKWKGIGPPITTGVWHSFEQYVKLSSVSGKGIYRVWIDGKLVMDDTATSNLKTSSSLVDIAYLWTYFNGGSGKDQEAYVDDIIITNETPSAVDSQGNRFIGIGKATFTSPPKPPTPQ